MNRTQTLLFIIPFICHAEDQTRHSPVKVNGSQAEEATLPRAKALEDNDSDYFKLPTFKNLTITGEVVLAQTINPITKKTTPLWTMVDLQSEEGAFTALFDHRRGMLVGPGGGDDAFAGKYFSPKGYSLKEARDLCAGLSPKGNWRLLSPLEALDMYTDKIHELKTRDTENNILPVWSSLGKTNWPTLKLAVQEPSAIETEFNSFSPKESATSPNEIGAILAIPNVRDIDKKLYKFKCTLKMSN